MLRSHREALECVTLVLVAALEYRELRHQGDAQARGVVLGVVNGPTFVWRRAPQSCLWRNSALESFALERSSSRF